MPKCIITGKDGENHHILSRKAYPQYKESEFNLLPLTRELHQEIHRVGRSSFIKKYKLENEMISRGFEYILGKWVYNI